MKRYTKFANKDPHPEVPFVDSEVEGLPSRGQVLFWGVAAFLAAVIGSYFVQ